MDQPVRLLRALDIVGAYFDEQESGGEVHGQGQRPDGKGQ